MCCRLETNDDQTDMYLMTMGILAVRSCLTPLFLADGSIALSIQGPWFSVPGVSNLCCHCSIEAKNTQDVPTRASVE